MSKAAQTGRQAEPRKGTIGHQGKGQKPYSASIRNNLRYFGICVRFFFVKREVAETRRTEKKATSKRERGKSREW